MVGVAIPNQIGAISVVALGGYLLVFLLSGLLFPIANIPEGIRWISNLVWGKHYITVVRELWSISWHGSPRGECNSRRSDFGRRKHAEIPAKHRKHPVPGVDPERIQPDPPGPPDDPVSDSAAHTYDPALRLCAELDRSEPAAGGGRRQPDAGKPDHKY